MKRRILLGWEFGAGNGHAVILRQIAQYFPPESHELRFAVRYPATAVHAGIDPRLVIETPGNPVWRAGKPSVKPVAWATYGEFVCDALMGPGRDFAQRLAGWDRIIASFKPDAIVAEYAPGLSLFARGRVPVVATGSGYSLPPVELVEFHRLTDQSKPRIATDEELLHRLNRHLREAGAPPIDRLPQLNAAEAHGLMTLPLFDPYAEHRGGGYLGVGHPGGSPGPADGASGFIAYFGEDWQLEDGFLGGLRNAGVVGQVYLGPPLRRTAKRLAGSGVTLADKPFNLAREMPGRAVAIHMGTLGFASAAALAGVPQIALYYNQENLLIAQALQKAGAAVILARHKITAAAIAGTIKAVAADDAMRAAARRLAGEVAPFSNRNPAREIAEIARGLAG